MTRTEELFGDSMGRIDVMEAIFLIFLISILAIAIFILIKEGDLDIANRKGRP